MSPSNCNHFATIRVFKWWDNKNISFLFLFSHYLSSWLSNFQNSYVNGASCINKYIWHWDKITPSSPLCYYFKVLPNIILYYSNLTHGSFSIFPKQDMKKVEFTELFVIQTPGIKHLSRLSRYVSHLQVMHIIQILL